MIDPRDFKNHTYQQIARLGKAVSSPGRLELLDLLCQGPRTVEELARQAGQAVANASRHLQILRAARLVDTEKKGLYVTYRLAGREVCDFYRTLRALAETRLAEIEQARRAFLEGRRGMEPVDGRNLLRRVRDGEAIVLDVRPREEYNAGHIPGALSFPLAELKRRLKGLPRDREIVAYCRGPYCVLAVMAVELLRGRGYRARRLEDGIPDWKARGHRVEVGP